MMTTLFLASNNKKLTLTIIFSAYTHFGIASRAGVARHPSSDVSFQHPTCYNLITSHCHPSALQGDIKIASLLIVTAFIHWLQH